MTKSRFLILICFIFSLASMVAAPVTSYSQDDELSLDDDFEDFDELDDGGFDDAEFDEITDEDLDEEDDFDELDEEGDDLEEFAEEDDSVEPLDDDEMGDDLEAELDNDLENDMDEVPEPEDNFKPDNLVVENDIDPSADNGPDLEFESELYNIYVKYHSQKIPEAEWENIIGARGSERYQIQRGDSLWEISETIFGDGNYWPKVWSVNGTIKNPHLIEVGNTIGFLLGTEADAPLFTVTKNEDLEQQPEITQEQVKAAEFEAEEDTGDDLVIPPPSKVSKPVLRDLPPSLPFFVLNNQRGEFDDAGISYGRRRITEIKDEVPLNYYISEAPILGLGIVSEIEEGSRIASAFQYIYVNVKTGDAQVGDRFLVLRNIGEVIKANEYVEDKMGYSIEVQGRIQLVERVEGKNESENGALFRALVTSILNPVTVDSILVDGKFENISIVEKGRRSQVVAQIIGGQYARKRHVYGLGSIAYLNRGTNDGLEEGQILPIRSNRVIRNENTLVEGNIRPIGWLKVVKTTPNFSTSIVVRAWSPIYAGDLTGSGMLSSVGRSARFDDSSDASGDGDLMSELDDEDSGFGDDEFSEGDDEGFEDEDEFFED